MCRWFKSKNYLLPADVEKGFMTSNFLTIKLGEKVTLPENIVCFVTYKDKTYYELSHGTYNLTRELLIDLYKKQYKVEDKGKNLAIDFFFVNTNQMRKEIVFSNKLSINNMMTKGFVRLYFSLKVVNPKTFSNYVRAEFAYVTAKDTDKYIFDDIQTITTQFLLRKDFNNFVVPEEVSNELKTKLYKKLMSVGLSLSDFKIELDSTKVKEKRSEFDFFSTDFGSQEQKQEELVQQKEIESISEQEDIKKPVETEIKVSPEEKPVQPQTVNNNICPVCKSKRIQNSIYCIRCGNRFN